MTDDAERWKEKYLKNLEQQEKLERRWDARLDLLRRGLVRSSLAAEGSDKAVDQCMKEMREVIRGDSMDPGLAALIPRLEKAVLDSEHRRETRMNQVRDALTSLVLQLQSLPLPGELARALKKLSKKLESGVSQSRELPPLLGELSGLQERALASLEHAPQAARPGLLQRLFGQRDAQSKADAERPAEAAMATGVPLSVPTAQAATQAGVEAQDTTELPAMAQAPAIAPPSPASALSSADATTSAPPLIPQAIPAPVPPAEAAAPPAPVAAPPASTQPSQMEPPSVPSQVSTPPSTAASDSTGSTVPGMMPSAATSEAATNDTAALTPSEPGHDVTTPESASYPAEPVNAPTLPALIDTLAAEEGPYALPHAVEPPYSQVAAHIEQTLLGLLDDLSLPAAYKDQAQVMRSRVARGLNWYELIPVLDDLAVLLLALNDNGQHEFEAYLQALDQRLQAFAGHLQGASSGHADNRIAAQALDSQLREQVDGLQHSVQGAADLDSLKRVLEARLEGLLGTLDEHRQARDLREQALAARLEDLVSRVANMEQEAQGYREHLEAQRRKALIDPLTGLANRAAWAERLGHEMQAWQQHGGDLALAMLDLDHFKRINDSYGHLAGDKVLKLVANVLAKRLLGGEFLARFGGEEFVLLMPQTSLTQAAERVESLREAIAACPFHFKSEPVTITASIGLSALRAGEPAERALDRADKALYRAKAQGRNRLERG